MTALKTIPAEGETTIISFYTKMARELSETALHMARNLASSLVERGWLPTVDGLFDQLDDGGPEAMKAALEELVAARVVTLDESGQRFTSLLGSISTARTPHRAHLGTSVDIFALGGMELLALNPMLAQPVDAYSSCGKCGADIKLILTDEAIQDAEPSGLAGYQATWDGESALADVCANSPLFCSDECLEAWETEHADVQGLPMSATLLLHVGMGMAQASGDARFQIIKAS